jgi:spore maturation protein SpmA
MNAPSKTDLSSNALNLVFVILIGGAVCCAAYEDKMQEITQASFDSAKSAVQLAINLIGIMALWLGLVRILEAGGLMHRLAILIKPFMKKLFPDVPAEHPAMSAMLLNIAANMLGLGNAATPLGLKAMAELDKLNPLKSKATNAMCLFLAINTSSVTLLPLGVIGVRAAAGAAQPANIFLPSLLATFCSTTVAIIAALFFARLDTTYQSEFSRASDKFVEDESEEYSSPREDDFSELLNTPHPLQRNAGYMLLGILFCLLLWKTFTAQNMGEFIVGTLITHWLMPCLMMLILCYGIIRGVKVYEAVTSGAKQGFDIAVRIIPFLVAILVAIGMFRASGALDYLIVVLEPITSLIGLPAEVLPMALIRPLSGTGAFGVMSALIEADPNSYAAYVASTMQGSTETTFYVLAVYFGAAGITKVRHAISAALLADCAGILASTLFCRLLW